MADNESKLSLENAKRVAGLLRPLSPQARNDLLIAKRDGDFASFQKVAFENRLDASSVWTGIDDLWQQTSQGVDIPIDGGKQETPSTGSRGLGIVGIGVAAGQVLGLRKFDYKRFQKETSEYGEEAVREWEKEEKKFQKKPPKKLDPTRARSAQEAYDRAAKGYLDRYVAYSEGYRKNADKWLRENPSDTNLALALNKASVANKNLAYSEINNIANKQRALAASNWDRTDPNKRWQGRAEALTHAHQEIYDHLTFTSPEAVEKWAREYNDPELQAALERKRQRDEAQAIANQGRISKMLGRNPAAKFASTQENIQQQATTRPPLPVLNPVFKTNPNQGSVNQTNNGQTTPPQNSEEPQANNSTLEKKSLKSRINHYRPSEIRRRAITRARTRISNSKLGQKIKNSKIGKASIKLNKMVGGASRATKRIKNLLNPLNYLLNLIKRSILGSLVSALASALTTVLSLAISTLVGITTAVVGVFSGAVGATLTAIGIPGLIIILIAALLGIVFVITTPCVIFCDQETRQFVDSPYPGISYSILAPETLPNQTNLNYSIVILVDTTKAQDSPKDLTAVADIPAGTTFISATGTYSLSDPGKIRWKLYPENSSPENQGKLILSFTFNLTVKPANDIVVENTLTIEGASGGAPPASGIAPSDTLCDRRYSYVLTNKLLPKNFGDPDCTMDTFRERNDLYDLLKEKDREWADFWFTVIIPGESGYRPNAWGCGSWNFTEKECNPPFAPRGAWGLFQMGSSRPPGETRARGGTRGDVTWKEQVDNAINHNRVIDKLGLRFKYWQVAINYCNGPHPRLNPDPCRDM